MTHTLNTNPDTDTGAWGKKATAFTVRAHRHLWGKNNEDPLAYLFIRGLNNQFIRDHYLGWNKFGQERPYKTWGLENEGKKDKFFLPPGIVIPYIKNKQLLSVFIHTYLDSTPGFNSTSGTFTVPGSRTSALVLGDHPEKVNVISDIMDGLLLSQETAEAGSVVILTDCQAAVDPASLSLMDQADQLTIYLKESEDRNGTARQLASRYPARLVTYKNPSDLTG